MSHPLQVPEGQVPDRHLSPIRLWHATSTLDLSHNTFVGNGAYIGGGSLFLSGAATAGEAAYFIGSEHAAAAPLSFPRNSVCTSFSTDCSVGPLTIPRYQLLMHPSNTLAAVYRSGLLEMTLDLDVTLRSATLAGNPVSADVEVLMNGAVVHAGTIDGFHASPGGISTWSGVLEVPRGSVLEVRVMSRGSTAQHDGVLVDVVGVEVP